MKTLRIRIWQFANSGANRDIWSIDDLSLVGLPSTGSTLTSVQLSPGAANDGTLVTNGVRGTFCGRAAIQFDSGANLGGIATHATNLPKGSSLHFDINFGCAGLAISTGSATVEYQSTICCDLRPLPPALLRSRLACTQLWDRWPLPWAPC